MGIYARVVLENRVPVESADAFHRLAVKWRA